MHGVRSVRWMGLSIGAKEEKIVGVKGGNACEAFHPAATNKVER